MRMLKKMRIIHHMIIINVCCMYSKREIQLFKLFFEILANMSLINCFMFEYI